MNEQALWENRFYVQTVTGVICFFLLVALVVFILQKKNPKWLPVWASVKSWILTTPVVFIFAALPSPWPLVFIVALAISGAKTFFRMTGMYHRSWFVWLTYIFITMQGYLIFHDYDRFYNTMPMLFLACASLIPLLRNSHTHMVQYVALALINFIITGWGFMHLGRIVLWEGGPLIVLYLVILFEFCEAANYALSKGFGRLKPLTNITSRFSVEGFFGSIALTVLLAWGLRHMLPDRSEVYWLSAGLIVSVVGRLGGLTLSFIRRDLNIKETGIFIIGRDDILARIDKPMFAAPVFYYAYLIIQGVIHL